MIDDNRKLFSKDCNCVDLACQSDHCGAPLSCGALGSCLLCLRDKTALDRTILELTSCPWLNISPESARFPSFKERNMLKIQND